MKRGSFVKNAAVLMVTAVLLRLVGMIFRIYVSAKVGAEGMGLYQVIFSLYTLVSTFATSGLSAAVTRLISDGEGAGEKQGLKAAMRRCLGMGLFLGLLSGAALYFGAHPAAVYLLKDARAELPLRILAPGLPFMALGAVIRGYFVARRNITLQSSSQFFEQGVRIAVVVWAMGLAANGGVEQACAAVMLGNMVSEAASGLFMLAGYLLDKKYRAGGAGKPRYSVFKKLLAIGAPVSAISCTRSLLHACESVLVPGRLALYYGAESRGLSAFGALKGMAMPLLMFPSSFLVTLSMLLVPEVSEAQAAGKTKKVRATVEQAIGITLILSLWLAGMFFLFANQLGTLLYSSAEVGFYLRALSPIVPFIYMESICEGLLRGLNEQASSLRYTIIDSGLRLGLIALLAPAFGMYGFLFMMLVSNIFTSLASFRRLLKTSGAKMRWKKRLWEPLLCLCLVLLTGRLCLAYTLSVLPVPAALCATGLVCGAIYAAALFGLGCIEKAEIDRLFPFLSRAKKTEA